MRRFFVPVIPPAAPAELPLPEAVAHYAVAVLRLDEGAEVELFDGKETVARGRLTLRGEARVLIDRVARVVAGDKTLVLAAALAKGDREDWLVEKAAELGVSRLVPLVCERSVVRSLSAQKLARYERLVQAAARQSGGMKTMTIAPLTPLAALPAIAAISLDPHAGIPLLAVARDVLRAGAEITLVIGPEGGLTERERRDLVARGAREAVLPGGTLRIETAALAAIAVAAAALSELSLPTS